MEKTERKLTQHQIQISNLLSAVSSKTSLSGTPLCSAIGKLKSRFGYNLCAEIFIKLPDMSGQDGRNFIRYAERVLQNEYVKRNPQGPDRVLANLSSMIGR